MGGDNNTVHIVTGEGVESLDKMPKNQVALALMEKLADAL
jgi:phosphopantothenoylcysteine decarboxylase / phosphopantothenate---cysteine ligase